MPLLYCFAKANNGNKIFFGRLWRDYSTVLFYNTGVEQRMAADGWSEWGGRLKTSPYREYKSHGLGVNGGHRIVDYPVATEKSKNCPGVVRASGSWMENSRKLDMGSRRLQKDAAIADSAHTAPVSDRATPLNECRPSGDTPFVTMVQAAHLGDRDYSA
jgi:hypothetical protein